MLTLTLLTIGLFGQGGKVTQPSMQFTNRTSGSIWVWVYRYDNPGWENGNKPLHVPLGATASIMLRQGSFQVVARNESRQEVRNNRVLAAGQLDWMDLVALASWEGTGPPFEIVKHVR